MAARTPQGTFIWTNEFEEKFTIRYKIDGRYYPATQYEPEEWPEVEIQSVIDEQGKEIIDISEEMQAAAEKDYFQN